MCVCVCVCVCMCVCVVWCVSIHNCLVSCWAPIRGSIPSGLEGGEVFCYADTIDENCQPAMNLKMWPPVCVCVSSSSFYSHPSSGRESRRVLLYGLAAIVRVDSHLENDSIQVSAVFPANTCLNCARSPSDSFSMTFRRASYSKTVDRDHFLCRSIKQQPNVSVWY